MSKKRSSREFSVPTATNQYNPISQSQCYDPSVHRTGRWTNEELAFRDAIIALFVEGSLPLSNGIKLNDFLSSILKSKQSRLTKKMKHAKLSSKYFRIKQGHLTPTLKAKEFSTLEHNFINAVPDMIERSEIQFHMQKEWRDHIAERLTNMHISFSADRWLHSVEIMDRRVALEKNRSRMAKRRCLMGLAMERDVKDVTEGVFINQDVKGGHDFLLDMDKTGAVMGGNTSGVGSSLGATAANTTEDGDFGRFLMSMLDEAPIAHNTLPSTGVLAGGKKALRSSCDPNFRYAAPFLAGITSYIERNSVPFEHVDLWVPSTVPKELESESSRPLVGSMGSGSNTALFGMSGVVGNTLGVTRLCFAGSATLGTQIVAEEPTTNTMGNENINKAKATTIPLSDDEIFNFSLYGDYSAKFSFSSGCGLPGRVFQSGIAAWEQYLTNAPPEMFERTGGAIQFGVRTALGLPIDSPTVGRIVLVLYSKHNREKDVELVNRIVRGVRLFNPSPRWKLVVDICSNGAADGENPLPVDAKPPTPQQPPKEMTNSSSLTGMSALSMNQNESLGLDIDEGNNMDASGEKSKQIMGLVNLLQEYMPSSDTDKTSTLGKQLNNMLLLRMLLLKPNRKPSEEEILETMLVLYESYLAAGRTRPDLAILIARDYNFQLLHTRTMANISHPQP